MPYRRQPIKTDKHEVTWSNLAQDASSVQTIVLVTGVLPNAKNLSQEVEVGSRLGPIFLEFNISPESVAVTRVMHWEVVRVPNSATPPLPSLYYQPGRNKIIKRGMEMIVTNVATMIKRIIVIPPKMLRRIGEGDEIQIRYISTNSATQNFCGIAIYKEYY